MSLRSFGKLSKLHDIFICLMFIFVLISLSTYFLVYLCLYVFVYLPICLMFISVLISLATYFFIYVFVYLLTCLMFISVLICLPTYLFVYLCLCVFVYLLTCLMFISVLIYLFMSLFIYVCMYLFTYLPVCVVQIRDGESESSPRLGRFCNTSLPRPLRTFGNQLWIKFAANSNRTKFSATYASGWDSLSLSPSLSLSLCLLPDLICLD